MQRRRTPRPALALAALSLLVGGCGSGSPSSSVASIATSASGAGAGGPQSTANTEQDALSFTNCMRSHGVPGFPDPNGEGDIPKQEVAGLASRPQFRAALTACRRFQPNGGRPNQSPARSPAQIAAMLAFARCIRGHGLAHFPDPTSSGVLSREMLAAAGVDVRQPAVRQDADACVGVTNGLITTADVARFAAGH